MGYRTFDEEKLDDLMEELKNVRLRVRELEAEIELQKIRIERNK